MSRDEIILLLKAHVGKAVRIVDASGDVERVWVVNVDADGFVADLEEQGKMVPHRTRFEDVESVLPSAGGLKYLPNCEEKQRLRDRCSEAAVRYASALNAVMRSRGKVAEEEYGRIRDLVDEARNVARAARAALQQHKDDHGC